MRVLVVDDQPELADDIADGLRDQGFGADVAYDGPTAIEKVTVTTGRLRRKLGEPDPIDTVVGSGYRLPEHPDAAPPASASVAAEGQELHEVLLRYSQWPDARNQ